MTFVNPYEYLRQELKDANSGEVIDIFLTSSERKTKKHHNAEDFEIGNPMFKFDTNGEPKMNFERLLKNLLLLKLQHPNPGFDWKHYSLRNLTGLYKDFENLLQNQNHQIYLTIHL